MTAGYYCDGSTITYSAEKSGQTLATVTGVKSVEGLSVSGRTVTVKASALGTDKVTISDGYTLKLDKDVTKPKTSASKWTLDKTTATYTGAGLTAGYHCDGSTITYSAEKSGQTLATVTGVKSVEGLSVNGRTVTVKASALGTDKVTVNDGYTLKLDKDVTKPKRTASAWTLDKTTATYTGAGLTAGYHCNGSAITYSEAKAGQTLATVTGVKSVEGLSVSGRTVTVAAAALGTDKVTVNDGYTLKLDKDVTRSKRTASAWTLDKTTATYKSAGLTAGYYCIGSRYG